MNKTNQNNSNVSKKNKLKTLIGLISGGQVRATNIPFYQKARTWLIPNITIKRAEKAIHSISSDRIARCASPQCF